LIIRSSLLFAGLMACEPGTDPPALTEADAGPLAAAAPSNKLFAVRVDPHEMTLEAGQSGIATCIPTTKSGTVLGTACTWRSTDTSRVKLVASGQQATVQAVKAGTARVIATVNRKRDSVVVTVTDPPPPPPTSLGIPFGPFALFDGTTTAFAFGPAPFTLVYSGETADRVVQRIAAVRAAGLQMVIAMTGGAPSNYTTDGKFDMAKWRARMDTYRPSAIQQAIADAIADSTILLANIIDEPNTVDWGGTVTRATLDSMSAYVKEIFPSVLTTISLQWSLLSDPRFAGPYASVDVITTQYGDRFGTLESYRDGAVAAARANNLGLLFSMNILNGGVQDKDGTWDCTGTGGLGTGSPNCRMTPQQVETAGTTLGLTPETCGLLLWRYDDAFFVSGPLATQNVAAMQNVATALAGRPTRACGK
jgi:hypothetical protein